MSRLFLFLLCFLFGTIGLELERPMLVVLRLEAVEEVVVRRVIPLPLLLLALAASQYYW